MLINLNTYHFALGCLFNIELLIVLLWRIINEFLNELGLPDEKAKGVVSIAELEAVDTSEVHSDDFVWGTLP